MGDPINITNLGQAMQGQKLGKLSSPKHTDTVKDTATLERVETPVFTFKKQEVELMPVLKPKYVERIEYSAIKGMNLILKTMPDKVEEQKEKQEIKQALADIYPINETYVNASTPANASMTINMHDEFLA